MLNYVRSTRKNISLPCQLFLLSLLFHYLLTGDRKPDVSFCGELIAAISANNSLSPLSGLGYRLAYITRTAVEMSDITTLVIPIPAFSVFTLPIQYPHHLHSIQQLEGRPRHRFDYWKNFHTDFQPRTPTSGPRSRRCR
jgi:hypothetical protein